MGETRGGRSSRAVVMPKEGVPLARVTDIDDPTKLLDELAQKQAIPLPKVPVGGCEIMDAAQDKNPDTLKDIVRKWPKSGKKISDVRSALNKMTPLMYACYGGCEPKGDAKDDDDAGLAKLRNDMVSCCHILVRAGVDINEVDVEGNTALHFATMSGHAPVVRYLLNNGASTLARNNMGQSPYEMAKLFTAHRCAALLSSHDGDEDMWWNANGTADCSTPGKGKGNVLSLAPSGSKTYGLQHWSSEH